MLDRNQKEMERLQAKLEGLTTWIPHPYPTPAPLCSACHRTGCDGPVCREHMPSAVARAPGVAPLHRVRRHDAIMYCQNEED